VILDKEEIEFNTYRLPALRRTGEKFIDYYNSSSDDCMQAKYLDKVKTAPTDVDKKFLKRYVDVCTPEELKLQQSRARVT